MELKTKYQYTYFIYPFSIKEENYKRYVTNLIKNKNYQIKFFDSFKDVELYKYFVPSVKEKMFQDFSFNKEKINTFYKSNLKEQIKTLLKQNCLIFEYVLENDLQGKAEEKDGIFFNIPKIELICFDTGICFLTIKTCLLETDKFEDILSFNYKFENINFENKNIKKLDNIKIQPNVFSNMNKISEVIEKITGQKLENKKIDIDENMFFVYTYACIDSTYWNKESDFENIENEFIKLAEIKSSDTNIKVDYDKLSILSNSSYLKLRVSNRCVAAICSSADADNYTRFSETYENQYLYTYILTLHQKYFLKKINSQLKNKPQKAIQNFIKFYDKLFISEITTESLGQKFYKRCKEKNSIDDIFYDIKNKYDVFYKNINVDYNVKSNFVLSVLFAIGIIIGLINLITMLI